MKTATDPTKTETAAQVELGTRLYRQMVRIRLFEEQVNELYTRALMPGLAHLYIGEEAVAVGICEALRKTAATATAWRKARLLIACSPSY